MVYTTSPKLTEKVLDKFDLLNKDVTAEFMLNKYYNTNLKLIKRAKHSRGMCFNYATKNYNLDT